MSCVLRAYGKEFDVDKFLENSNFSPCALWHKGEPRSSRRNAKINNESGFNIDVSEADFDEFEIQMTDAIVFFKVNKAEIKRLKSFPGVDEMFLDFAVNITQEYFSRCLHLDNLLMKEAVRFGVGIEISVYKTEN